MMHTAAIFQAFKSKYYVRHKCHLMRDIIFKSLCYIVLTPMIPKPCMKVLHRVSSSLYDPESNNWQNHLQPSHPIFLFVRNFVHVRINQYA